MTTKINPEHEKEAREFLESTLKRPLPGDLADVLHDGQVLCEFVNVLKPGSVAKINKQRFPAFQSENIGSAIAAIKKMGVPDSYIFVTIDLYERKNMAQVILCLNTLKRTLGMGFVKASGPGEMKVSVLADCSPASPAPASSAVATHTAPVHLSTEGGVSVYERGVTAAAGNTCAACAASITGNASVVHVNGQPRYYHQQCFCCGKCGGKLGSKYYDHGGPHCERCSLQLRAANRKK